VLDTTALPLESGGTGYGKVPLEGRVGIIHDLKGSRLAPLD